MMMLGGAGNESERQTTSTLRKAVKKAVSRGLATGVTTLKARLPSTQYRTRFISSQTTRILFSSKIHQLCL
jgi:hypothetical protein